MSYERFLVLFAIAVLSLAGWWFAEHPTVLASTFAPGPSLPKLGAQPSNAFSLMEIRGFLSAAAKSEEETDPLQRCLDYPDPPGSHWSRPAVVAYCTYRFQHILSMAEARQLIHDGHANEVDRRLADALRAEQSDPASRGLLERIYFSDFDNGSPEVRETIDAWKRQSPNSGFALAASGFAYVAAASDARGSNWASETPASNFAAMGNLLGLARADLAKATQIDPQIMPIYVAELTAVRMDSDAYHTNMIARSALEIDRSNYAIYALLMEQAKPKWGGSVPAMEAVAADAKARVGKNPMLELLLVEPAVEAYDICGCRNSGRGNAAPFKAVLDQAAATRTLSSAGNNAYSNGQREFTLVYLAEALRFDPDLQEDRMIVIYELMSYRNASLVRDAVGRVALAESDRAAALSPSDLPTLARLGDVYTEFNQWDKGWAMAEKMISAHPDQPEGWVLRAHIQSQQPRPGVHDTAEYIVQHFSDNPRAQPAVAQARWQLSNESSGH